MLGSERLGLVGTKLLGFCPGVGLEALSPPAVVLEEMLGFPELCHVLSCPSSLLGEESITGLPKRDTCRSPCFFRTFPSPNWETLGSLVTRPGAREDVPSAASAGERSPPRAASRGHN